MFDFNGSSLESEAADQILELIEKNLHKMRSLAIFAAQNDLSTEQRTLVQSQIDDLKREIDGIAAMLVPPDIPLQ